MQRQVGQQLRQRTDRRRRDAAAADAADARRRRRRLWNTVTKSKPAKLDTKTKSHENQSHCGTSVSPRETFDKKTKQMEDEKVVPSLESKTDGEGKERGVFLSFRVKKKEGPINVRLFTDTVNWP